MKKFTLLIALCISVVSFGQNVASPVKENPTRTTQRAEAKKVPTQNKTPYASFSQVPEEVIAGKARLAAAAIASQLNMAKAKYLQSSSNLTVNGTSIGKPVFSPETVQKTGQVNLTASSSEMVAGANVTYGPQTVNYTTTKFNGYSYKGAGNGRSVAVLAYESGPYFSVAGPPDLSILENVTLGMNTLGGGMQVAAGNRMSEDIVLSDDYDVTELVFFGYQTGAPTSPPTINEINVQIWDGDPSAGGSSVIWGDDTTNVLDAVVWSDAYRLAEDNPGNTDRAIFRISVAPAGLSLPAGTYWVDWQVGGTLASGPWQPPVVITGQSTTGNAQQSIAGVWGAWLDTGTGTQLGAPIQVYGDCTSCGGGGGDIVYANDASAGNFVSFDKTAPGAPTTIGPNSGTGFEGAGAIDPNDTNTAYVIGDDTLFSLDITTGAYTNLGAFPNPNGLIWTGLAYDPSSGTLYACATDITQSNLYTVDPGAVSATLVGSMGLPATIDIAIDNSGQGYTYDIVNDTFSSFDIGTGASTLIGSLGFDANFGQGLAYDSVNDVLYMNAFNNSVGSGEWREVDRGTGASTLIGAFPAGDQVPWASVDVGGGGGGGGCTAGVFSDRASFEAAFTGTLNLEDFEGGPGAITACDGPINAAGNSCYPAGEILDGVEVDSVVPTDPANNTVVIPAGAFGNPDVWVGPNTFVDVLEINFPDGDIDAFGVDIGLPLAGSTNVDVRIYGTGGLITTETVTVPGGATSAFFGYISAEPILTVEIEDSAGAGEGELIGMAAFGTCDGGGGGGGCGDFSYANTSPTGNGVPAQTFPDFPDFDCQAVDDIVLPGPDAGELCSLSVTGTYTAGGLPSDPANTVELTIYEDAAGQPGSVFYTESFPNSVDADGDGSFTLEPTGAPTLNPGTRYWVQVVANMGFTVSGQWFWSSATDGNDDAGLWQNPGGGFATCVTWGTFASCGVGGGLGPDLLMDAEFIAVPIITYDTCEGALPIACGESVLGDTLTATADNSVAPDCDTSTSAPGVWYKYEDTTGLVTDILVSTCSTNTDYDTKISVYTGECSSPPLTCVAGNDDSPNCTNFQSEVEFQSDGNTTFYILVHGFAGDTGNFELTMTCVPVPPPNDDIVNAIDLDEVGCPFTDEDVAMPAATTEGGNPTDCDLTGANGVWYKFTPETEGTGFITGTIASPAGAYSVTFYTAPDENASETDLVLVDYFQNQCVEGQDSATIPVEVGQTYYCFVLNTGGITDIIFDNCQLAVESNEIEGFAFAPNPTSGALSLTSTLNIENVALYNILGQKVLDVNVNATTTELNVSSIAAGAYFMKVTVDGQTGTYKVIKK
ncbi:MAG TPA: T9SS type A sorting domain-containing protein [Flavobacteriaceae bacterium]|nr:T9SS type A sorting domain-containing protein [Flavobacteriaceae bacterium]HPF11929.1 T9SS type A sorting domain-containing protein [Flavobacteriaceae bacterium]HQU21923.1 T9SS type A sorting domain-containing protein [Flavobacteriaceae bacterium]HQU65439.1 T9SS type A sorting domain-containing protein [Flavobacteriaceae bacterium]HRW45019.1 T9SS type A sorting domain-containing protein [Flavobacteriaceae bacterium]